jgi:hypothetical protein
MSCSREVAATDPIYRMSMTVRRRASFCADCYVKFTAKMFENKLLAPGSSFTPKQSDARYCSSACKQKAFRRRSGRFAEASTASGRREPER